MMCKGCILASHQSLPVTISLGFLGLLALLSHLGLLGLLLHD